MPVSASAITPACSRSTPFPAFLSQYCRESPGIPLRGARALPEDATNYSYGTNADADYQQNLNLAASYEMKDTFKAYVAWNNSANEVSVGVNLMATKPLTVQVVYDDDYTAPVKTSTVWLTAGYTMGALALTLDAGYANGINQYQSWRQPQPIPSVRWQERFAD